MRASSYKLLSRYFLLLGFSLVSCLAVSESWLSFAQNDPCAGAGATVATGAGAYNFKQGDTVYIEMDTQFDQNVRGQVVKGFASWNIANQNYNYSGIFYEVNGRPANAPPNASQINVTSGVIYNNDGSIAYDVVAQFQPNVFNDDGTLRFATIVFNTAATVNAQPSGAPYFDPNAAIPQGATSNGYDTVFEKLTTHEAGHGQGIDHPTNEQPRQSVMNTASQCPNENCNNMPMNGVQPCDNKAVNQVPEYQVFIGGGGGGGGDGNYYSSPDPDPPGSSCYDVYYPHDYWTCTGDNDCEYQGSGYEYEYTECQ